MTKVNKGIYMDAAKLNEMTVPELKDYALTLNVEIKSSDVKPDIVSKILVYLGGGTIPPDGVNNEGTFEDANAGGKSSAEQLMRVTFHTVGEDDAPIYMCIRDDERVYPRDEECEVPLKFVNMLKNECIKVETKRVKDKKTGDITEKTSRTQKYSFEVHGPVIAKS